MSEKKTEIVTQTIIVSNPKTGEWRKEIHWSVVSAKTGKPWKRAG